MRKNLDTSTAANNRAGFTVVELLIAMLIAAIVTSAALGIYITQRRQLIGQDQVSDMQANVRAAAAELASRIRMAGYNVPKGILPLAASDSNPDTIIVTYDGGGLEGVSIAHPMPQPSAELRCDGHDVSALREGEWCFIYDPDTETGEFFPVTGVQRSTARIQHSTMPLSRSYPAGSRLYAMNQFKYYIDNTDPAHPDLICWTHGTGPQVFAENIADLNFRYILASGATVDLPPMPDMIREVIIEINGRTERADDEFAIDHRTRALDTRVRVRNLGMGS